MKIKRIRLMLILLVSISFSVLALSLFFLTSKPGEGFVKTIAEKELGKLIDHE